ncbi:DUF1871 family protein [Sutcliffiella rhizosphaerae]|uniref:DUF1871 family protein n=1 Tax=Sutcliffiella rhizosphaerae TaxID=2880967 RepID=A0ABM8YNX4_9BACI|nr:DUF1871 family protein [Sutcliffiella rhizosphaerae]CAG9621620.1 hypothetical protein BACCIP111883_02393 [Sutcliffiella rhizosphaerae]
MELSTKKRLIEVTKTIVNDWDPLDFLALGAHEDKYIKEVCQIIKYIEDCQSVEELAVQIKTVFDNSFSTDLSPITCLQVAVMVWEEIR